MSDDLVHLHSDGDESVHPYQSLWMSHCKHASCKSADQACTHVITNYDFIKNRHDSKRCLLVNNPELGIKVFECVRGSQQVGETRAASSKNGSHTSTASLKKIKNKSLDYQPLQRSSFFMNKSQMSSRSTGGIAVVNGKCEASLMEFASELKAFGKYPEKQARSIDFLDNNSIVSKIFQDDFKGLASKYLPFQFLSKGLPLHSTGEEQNNQPFAILSSEEHLSKTNQSRFSPHMNKDFLLQDASPGQDQKPDLECDDVRKHSNCGLFKSRSPSHLTSPRMNKLHNECYSSPTLPLSIHDVKSMRISTTIDSLEQSSGGSPKISKTTSHFLVSKKTCINLSEEAQMLRESTITTKVKEKHLSDLFGESIEFSIHNQKKANTPQSSGSSRDITDIGTSAVCPTNDTDTMDLDPFHENNLAGLASHPLNKDLEFELDRKARSHDASNWARESSGHLNSEIPDISKEVTEFPIQENEANMKEASRSTTRSLDLFKSSKSTSSANDSFKQNLNSRWVRRLKCNGSSDCATGHGNSQTEGASLGRKAAVQTNKTINLSRSKPSIGESYAKKQKIYDRRKNRETLLSHPWIQRWCTPMSGKKLEPMVVCEPECSTMALNEYQEKQFPSIAAMALMGKAMNGFQPCELRTKGSYSVWNTKDF